MWRSAAPRTDGAALLSVLCVSQSSELPPGLLEAMRSLDQLCDPACSSFSTSGRDQAGRVQGPRDAGRCVQTSIGRTAGRTANPCRRPHPFICNQQQWLPRACATVRVETRVGLAWALTMPFERRTLRLPLRAARQLESSKRRIWASNCIQSTVASRALVAVSGPCSRARKPAQQAACSSMHAKMAAPPQHGGHHEAVQKEVDDCDRGTALSLSSWRRGGGDGGSRMRN